MLLFPRLHLATARERASELAILSPMEARERADVSHPDTHFSPTGGNIVEPGHLRQLQQSMRELAAGAGFPEAMSISTQQDWDASAAHLLHTEMNASPAEASHVGLWAFISCVLLPDLVRWRFPGQEHGTVEERFLGGARGQRNTFGRLWWRAHLLGTEEGLLDALNEDELVQILERPTLARSAAVSRAFAKSFLSWASEVQFSRSDLMRDVVKRLRRFAAFLSLESLSTPQFEQLLDELFRETVLSLERVAETEHREGNRRASTKPAPPRNGALSRLRAMFRREPRAPDDVLAHLEGYEVIDMRAKAGRLWVIGGEELQPVMAELQRAGLGFAFARKGARSTAYRPAWYHQTPR